MTPKGSLSEVQLEALRQFSALWSYHSKRVVTYRHERRRFRNVYIKAFENGAMHIALNYVKESLDNIQDTLDNLGNIK